MNMLSAIINLFRQGTSGFSEFELKILFALEGSLDPQASEKLLKRIKAVNFVQRLDGGREIDAYSMRRGKAQFSEDWRIVPSTGEQKLAQILIDGPPGTANRCSAWLVDGKFFSLEFDKPTEHADAELVTGIHIKVLLSVQRST